jgi:hypothetical protein
MAAVTCAVIAVAGSSYASQAQRNAARKQMKDMGLKPSRIDKETIYLYEQMKLHRAKMEADGIKTIRDAKIGMVILIALVITVGVGIGQLLGLW